MKLIYINTRKIEAEQPPITVDDPESTIAPQDYSEVRIGRKTRVVWDKKGHERGPRVYILTDDKVEME